MLTMLLQTRIIPVAFALISCMLCAGSVQALKIEPTILDLQGKPGEIVSRAVRITNDSVDAGTYTEVIYDVGKSSGVSGAFNYEPKTPESTLSNWIDSIKINPFTLAAGESRELPIKIIIPSDAAPGGHYAMISWGDVPPTVEPGSAAVSGAVGVNIALDIAGTAVDKGSVARFETEGGLTKYERLPITFVASIANSGNRHFKPEGSISIKDSFGRVVAILPFNDVRAAGNVLPNSTREFLTSWKDGFAFGKYTASLDITLGKAGPAAASISFWVLPTGLLILWLIIAAVIVTILVMLINNMVASMRK